MNIYTNFISLPNYFIKVLSKNLFNSILKLWEQSFRAKMDNVYAARKEFIFERKDFMKFKVVGKSLILKDCSQKITEGENYFDTVEIAVPRYHDDCDLSTLSFRFSETSEESENSAVQLLHHEKCDEKYIYLKGTITSDFSAITGKVIFMLTGINDENIVAKFQSDTFTVNNDISLKSLPNESTAEQIYNQTHLEAVKAYEAAKRAEKASQTPAPAEIYPATNERLGGVLSGNDISVDESGNVTVNSINGKDPENGIADVKASQKTISSLAVQIAHPNNFLIYDDLGKPSVMVAIPKFYLDEVIDGASHTVHPAFIVNGVEQDVIYISKYQNIVENGRAYSLPMKSPQTGINFDQAYDYCKAKGEGWHLMTNAEWAAIALWCKKNGTMPKGNNNYGKDISETLRKAVPITFDGNGRTNKVVTGSGNANWYHDGTFSGIADLNGNIWEWNSGMRLKDGEIQVLANNNAADWNNPVSSDSALWKAIMPDGSLAVPGTDNTLKYNRKNNKWIVGIDISNQSNNYYSNDFETLTADSGITIPEILKALALYPADPEGYEGDCFYAINHGERLPLRGGNWSINTSAGIFHLSLTDTKSFSSTGLGFRCAYCKLGATASAFAFSTL